MPTGPTESNSPTARSYTERLANERSFHDDWARTIDPETVDPEQSFAPDTAIENHYVLARIGSLAGKRILDIGCGSGEAAVYFAQHGAQVTAMDLSGAFVRVARRVAGKYAVPLSLAIGAGESLPYRDGSFDIVYGHGVLHHLEMSRAMQEFRRVLRVGGKGLFIEPLGYNPLIDVYRWMAGAMRTPDERPLRFTDIGRLQSLFTRVDHKEFWLTTQLVFVWFLVGMGVHPARERYWKKVLYDVDRIRWLFRPLYGLERRILKAAPWLGRYCWTSVICLEK